MSKKQELFLKMLQEKNVNLTLFIFNSRVIFFGF
jgi:hypothetical protein